MADFTTTTPELKFSVHTGAAILRKDKAAYISTSIAASATTQREMKMHQEVSMIEFSEPLKPSIRLRFDRKGIVETLDRLGFAVPSEITALAASSTAPLGSAGYSIKLSQLDQALKKFELKTHDRIGWKNELSRQGLLK